MTEYSTISKAGQIVMNNFLFTNLFNSRQGEKIVILTHLQILLDQTIP